MQGFCTKCGAPLQAGGRFCTSCGTPSSGNAPHPPASSTPTAAIAAGLLLVTLGSVAAYFALRTDTEVPRAVAGSPGVPAGNAPTTGNTDGLPSGHPSIELPKEVVDFLEGLAAEAEKNPQSIEAIQKLAHARYRASVINASYRVSAQQALDRLLTLDPQNIDGLRISANLAYDSGNFAEAEKRFRTFLARYPDDASAITDLGSALLFQDKTGDAIVEYQKAIAKNPKFMQARFNLGVALEKQGKKDEAIAALKSALDLAETPDEQQHVENALSELEGREPMQIAGARTKTRPPGSPAGGSAPAGGSSSPAGGPSPSGDATPPPAGGATQGGMPMPPPAPDRSVPTNAGTDFQRQAEKPLITHPMIGPRVVSFDWKSPTSMSLEIADFPMDQMPPFARTKFKSAMSDKLREIAVRNGVAGPLTVTLIDRASGNVMDTIDVSASSPPAGAPQ